MTAGENISAASRITVPTSTATFGPPLPPGARTANQDHKTTIVNNIQDTANAKETAQIATDAVSDAMGRELGDTYAAVLGGG